MKAFCRASVCYLQPVPFQRKKFFSRLLRNTAFAVIAQQALHAGLGNLLYPSAADKFTELGVDKAIVDKMDLPPFAFVRPAPQNRNFVDKLYEWTDAPTLAGLLLTREAFTSRTHGKAIPYPVCDIAVANESGVARNWIRNATLLPEARIKPSIGDNDMLSLILAHEVGHCDWREHITAFVPNLVEAVVEGTLPTLMESEIRRAEFHSDLSAMSFARSLGDTDKAEMMMDFLVASRSSFQYYIWNAETGYAYDYGPSLDASRKNGMPFSLAEFKDSRKELSDYVMNNLSYETQDDYTFALVSTLERFIEEKKDAALPLSVKRAESFVKAIQYFAPAPMEETAVAEVFIEELGAMSPSPL